MAQGTANKRFLAPRPSTASARAILALAGIAALSLSGCGSGGGEDSGSTKADATGAKTTAQPAGGGDASTPSASAKAGKADGSQSSPSAAAAAPTAAAASGAGKQGPHIKAPKGEPERAATPAELQEATVADISLWSSSMGGSEALPSTYTCDGKNSWPQLRWSGVPAGTKELALLTMSVQPVEGKLVYDWAIAGLDPSLEEIEAGKLPRGAITATNSFGHRDYEICPQEAETYVFALFALPKALSPAQGFDPSAFREQVLAVSGNVGLLAASYARG
jgi:phosphatidylethanolamine-binding protein (PEBP) family uncharacterized protein